MTIRNLTATGLLLAGMGSVSLASPPPLDRPTPPPCCADGRCYPNPLTYGWYETRWRRWPLECMEPIPAGQMGPTSQQPGEMNTFEPPGANEEDRKAPPPTTPREEPLRAPATNAEPGGTENRPPGGQPPAGPLMQPGEPVEPGSPRRSLPPYEPQVPGPKSLNSTGPTSDLDPPPALPFGPRTLNQAPPVRAASQPSEAPVRRPVRATGGPPSDDPPPSLPGALANWTN